MNTRETRKIVNLEKSIKMLEEKVCALQKENEHLKGVLKIQSVFNEKQNDRIVALSKRNDEISSFIQKDLQNTKNDIQVFKKILQSLKSEMAEAQKQIDAFRDGTKPTGPEPSKPKFPSDVDLMKYTPYLSADGSIKYKIKGEPHQVPSKVVQMALEATTLKAFFQSFGLAIKDNRARDGYLWVRGSTEELAPFVGIAFRKFACNGTFTDNGWPSGFKIGWFTKCML